MASCPEAAANWRGLCEGPLALMNMFFISTSSLDSSSGSKLGNLFIRSCTAERGPGCIYKQGSKEGIEVDRQERKKDDGEYRKKQHSPGLIDLQRR